MKGNPVIHAGGSAQVRTPLIVQPIAEQRQRNSLGVGTAVPTTPYKSGSQGNRRDEEASISEEASEGSVGKPLVRVLRFLFLPLRDPQLPMRTGACGRHMSRSTWSSVQAMGIGQGVLYALCHECVHWFWHPCRGSTAKGAVRLSLALSSASRTTGSREALASSRSLPHCADIQASYT